MKRIISLVLVLVTAMSLVACGGGSGNINKDMTKSIDNKKILEIKYKKLNEINNSSLTIRKSIDGIYYVHNIGYDQNGNLWCSGEPNGDGCHLLNIYYTNGDIHQYTYIFETDGDGEWAYKSVNFEEKKKINLDAYKKLKKECDEITKSNFTGWKDDYYYISGKLAKNSWVDNDYYVNNDGLYVKNEWVKNDDKWYYCGNDGKYLKNKWENIRGVYYYFLNDGSMATNQWIDNLYYVGTDGTMLKDTVTPDGYFVDANGKYINKIETQTQKVKQKTSNIDLNKIYNEIKSNPRREYGAHEYLGLPHSCYSDAKFNADGSLWLSGGAGNRDGWSCIDIIYANGTYDSYYQSYGDINGDECLHNGKKVSEDVIKDIYKKFNEIIDEKSLLNADYGDENLNQFDNKIIKKYTSIKTEDPNGIYTESKLDEDGRLWIYNHPIAMGFAVTHTISIFDADSTEFEGDKPVEKYEAKQLVETFFDSNSKSYSKVTWSNCSLNGDDILEEEFLDIVDEFSNMEDCYNKT